MTKSTITREQLTEELKRRILVTERYPDLETAQIDAIICKMAMAAMDSEPVAECEKLATENFRTAMEGIGHIRRTLDETFGGLHGTHVEPDVLDECKAICDAIYAAYRHAQPATASEPLAVTDDELNAALQLHRLKVDGHSQLSDAFRAGFRYARRTTPQPAPVAPVCTCPSGDGSLRWPCPVHTGNSPVIPDGYVIVPKDLLSDLRDWAHPEIEKYCEMWEGRRDSEFPALRKVIADADALLAAALQDFPALNSMQSVATVPGKWIPVSERMPIEFEAVIAFDGDQVYGEAMYSSDDGFTIDGYDPCDRVQLQNVTHWMPLPSAPQEVKGE